jgi:hypothetical protein
MLKLEWSFQELGKIVVLPVFFKKFTGAEKCILRCIGPGEKILS